MMYLFVAIVLLLPVVADAKEVVIPYDDFLVMLSTVEHKDKLLKQCAAEREILVKLNDENGAIKRLNAQQVEVLSKEIQEHEKLGETQEQIARALEAELRGEKRLSRYKSEAFWLGVVAVVLWAFN